MTHGEVEVFKYFIAHKYTYRLYIDDLPSATIHRDPEDKSVAVDYLEGIPIGVYSRAADIIIIYNHLNITVYTHTTLEGYERIVGFEVEPMSLGEGDKRMLYDPDNSNDVQWLKAGE